MNVVDTLAAFGLAYVFVKLFVGMLQEVKQVGVVLVHDRPGFHKLLLCVVVMGIAVTIIIVVIGECMPHLTIITRVSVGGISVQIIGRALLLVRWQVIVT